MKRCFVIFLVAMTSRAFSADVSLGTFNNGSARSMRSVACTTASVCYAFYLLTNASNADVVYRKTTDGGATWASSVTVKSGVVNRTLDIWYDKWTPANTGTLIHAWYLDGTNADVFYRTLDTSSDTLGTERTVFNGASAVAGRGIFCSGTETRSGYLYCAFDIDAGAEKGLYRSTDSGVNWSSLSATFVEATIDQCLLFPATGTGDNNDMWAIYQDASADALTMKMWDSSAAGEVESSTMQTMVENTTDLTGQMGFSGSVRLSDGDIIVVSSSERDTSTADMQAWDVSAVNSGSLTGITAKTDITTNIDDNYHPAVYIDSSNKIYVAYNGKRDGSEALGSNTKIYYTKSTDGGTTWSSGDTAFMEGSTTGTAQVWTPLSGPLFLAMWRDVTLGELITNAVNRVVGPTGSGNFFPFFQP